MAACAATAPEQGPEDAGSTAATAVVAVERTVGPGDAVRSDTVFARFVRVRQGAVDEAALRVAGITADVPAAGSCAEPGDPATTSLAGRGVELLDVGPVTVASAVSDARGTVLVPRSMPDPAGVVSGVFYSARTVDAFAAGSRVALKTAGGADLDGFALSATAPRELADVKLATYAGGFDVTWDAGENDAKDLFYVEVLAPAPHVVVRCTAAESGHVAVPYAGADDGQVIVHRLHRESFRAKGIEPGEVRFDLAKVIAFRR